MEERGRERQRKKNLSSFLNAPLGPSSAAFAGPLEHWIRSSKLGLEQPFRHGCHKQFNLLFHTTTPGHSRSDCKDPLESPDMPSLGKPQPLSVLGQWGLLNLRKQDSSVKAVQGRMPVCSQCSTQEEGTRVTLTSVSHCLACG